MVALKAKMDNDEQVNLFCCTLRTIFSHIKKKKGKYKINTVTD